MRVTAHDVAEAAGVSRSAVSRAFTEGASIAPEKRQRILSIASMLGYQPNRIARGLSGRRTGLVALVFGRVSSPYEAWLLDHLSQAIRARGKWPLLLSAFPEGELDGALAHALSYQVDGAIVAAGSVSRTLAERCAALGAPIVMVGRILDGVAVDAVCCDNALGMRQLVELLVSEGRHRIAWIGGKAEAFSNVERQAGLLEALSGWGLEPWARRVADYSVEGGMLQALALLTADERPDAILCGNDAMALGAISAARRLGLGVPEEIAIAGFDDIPAAAWEPYLLTTVCNPVAETAAQALRLLEQRIDDGARPHEVVRLTPRLVRRRSA
ncbi:LacI family DNA-binding transcriptional regulator [Halomonas sp. MCCC 1A11036]|uniref:LacI family DNA-binding transcriptional regulator n=2 Tax=Billgrantia zhangzhouensis TaxID=2733481 RepID=A0ABS9AG20_9GAMM|nr:LacI family DNA-binding transcriptional regulator [Halomonas zhangzhouensis]